MLEKWFPLGADYSVVMTWPDKKSAGGLAIASLGVPKYDVVDHYDFSIVRTELTAAEKLKLKIEDEEIPF